MTFKATYLGSNGWIVEFNNTRIIIDPWLKGDLIFPLGGWFFKGILENEIPTPENIDLILLTQGLPDHCHEPTLKLFPKEIEIITPKSAIKILKNLGFKSINTIEPGQKLNLKYLSIEATAGAPVPNIENGYIVENDTGGFYIEPHGFFDEKIIPRKLDVVITPTKNLDLPLVGPFVKGAEVIPKLIKAFEPEYILSSTIGGKAKFSGFLNKFISVKEFEEALSCKLIDLNTLESINI